MQLSSTWFICSPKQLTASPRVLSGLCSWPSRPCGEEMVFGSLCCSHGAGSQGSRSQPEGCRSLWMGLGSVPMAFWCWVAPFVSGSWSTQRATSEIPLSTSFLWSMRCIEIDETIKVISHGGNGSWGWVFGCWTNWAAETEWLGKVIVQRRWSGWCWCASCSMHKAGLERPKPSND